MAKIPHAPEFPPTRWTLVSLARSPDDPEALRALEQICERYWYPVYAFIRRCGASPEDAEDTTQNFFATIREHIAKADAEKGRLRTFFMAIARKKLADDRKRRGAKKRGGHLVIQSLDETVEGRFSVEPLDSSATPEEFYEYVWAKEITLNCLAAVGREWDARNRGQEFEALKPLILRPMIEFDSAVTRKSARTSLGVSNDSLRQKIKTIRDRLWSVLAAEVRGTLADPGSPDGMPSERLVADEVAHLFSVLSAVGPGLPEMASGEHP